MSSQVTTTGPFRAIAHRGDPQVYRENTLASISSAVAAGADLVEIDVRCTADGAVVLLHDDTLTRLWGVDRRIVEVTEPELVDIGEQSESGLRIPTLADALRTVAGQSAAVLIDIADPAVAGPAQAVTSAAVSAGVVTAEMVAWCGASAALRTIRAADPNARIFLSWNEWDGHGPRPDDSLVEELRPEVFNPYWPMVTEASMAWARERGMAMCCWTVDEAEQMQKLRALGVSAMISNRIGLLKQTLADADES